MSANVEPRQLFKRNGRTPEAETDTAESLQNQAALFVGITAGEASRMGYWIPIGLKAYAGMSCLMRTNNYTKVRRERPVFFEPFSLRAQRRELKRVNEAVAELFSEELEQQQITLLDVITEASTKYEDEYHAEQCRWLSRYVLAFDPWPFDDIPQPHPEDPDSYIVLRNELEDLYTWLLNDGYAAALATSSGNS